MLQDPSTIYDTQPFFGLQDESSPGLAQCFDLLFHCILLLKPVHLLITRLEITTRKHLPDPNNFPTGSWLPNVLCAEASNHFLWRSCWKRSHNLAGLVLFSKILTLEYGETSWQRTWYKCDRAGITLQELIVGVSQSSLQSFEGHQRKDDSEYRKVWRETRANPLPLHFQI